MTQYTKEVEKQKQILEEEAKANEVIAWDVRFKDGKWTKEITTYGDGRTVTKFADKRKKDIEE
tara:strand:- start:171 stop:359 length:189 start_codon:yes stop_codon:yes gene_type:complete